MRRPWHRYGVRFWLPVLVVCCLAVAGLAMPAASLAGRILASSGSTASRPSAVSGSGNLTRASSSSAAPTSAGSAGTCSNLYFISARGSGEPSTGTGDETASRETDSIYKAIAQQLKSQGVNPSTTFYQLPYSAPSIKVLLSGLRKPTTSTLGLTVEADWDQLMDVNLPKYIAGEEQGESELYAYLAQIYHTCSLVGKHPMVVLAGFSQGAMVVHNMLNTVATNNQVDLESMIKGAVLIADPERMPYSDVANLGTAKVTDYGLCHALDILPIPHSHVSASCVPPGTTTDVSAQFSSVAYQVCDTNDLVCDTSGLFKLTRDVPSFTNIFAFMADVHLGSQTHTLSYTGGEMRTAGRRVARSLIADGLGGEPSPSPSASPSTSTSPGAGLWTAIPAPAPANAGTGAAEGQVSGVSCPTASYCVAVGYYLDASSNWDGLLLTWSDGAWTAAEAPIPGGALSGGTFLYGVSCASASYCVAVGTYGGNQGGLLLTWSGGAWTVSEAPLPQGSGSYGLLYGVSCPSASYCVAVGQSYSPSFNNDDGLLLTLAGGSWTPSWMPPPAGTNNASLAAVSCPSESYCVASGWYRDTSDNYYGLGATLSGGSWTSAQTPGGVGSTPYGVELNGVSCPSTAYCVATTGNGVLLTLSGGTWSEAQTPVPSEAASPAQAEGGGVSCLSADSCVAVGRYLDSSGDWDALLLSGSGGTWSAAGSPPAGNLSALYPIGVACPSASYCVAVGTYQPSDYDGGMLMTWSG
jgi:hypothetical protein